MGPTLLVLRLVWADIRVHWTQASVLVLSLTFAIAMLALGGALGGATDALYRHTRDATAGPDIVVVSPDTSAATAETQARLIEDPAVTDHNGPYLQYYTQATAHGSTSHVVVEAAPTSPGPLNQPHVTAGTWLRAGGVVVERGFARALGVDVGDQIAIAGRPIAVVGIAVTAANAVYPGAQLTGAVDYAGLVWMRAPDIEPLAASQRISAISVLDLKLQDSSATQQFVDAHQGTAFHATYFTWQFIADVDAAIIKDSQPVLVLGSWLLSFLAIAGASTLAAGRAAKQTLRAGVLKAVGASPELIASVLLTEYALLALLAVAGGLTMATFLQPLVVNPTDSLLVTHTWPAPGMIVLATVVALVVALAASLGPTLRAVLAPTVAALSANVRQPERRSRLTRAAGRLPSPVMLGLRLASRRPGRAWLQGLSMTSTVIAITALAVVLAQPHRDYGIDSPDLTNLKDAQSRQMIVAVAVTLGLFAAVNTLIAAWTTAQDARRTLALARALGATPGQVTAGIATAQLLPSVPGALLGVPLGTALCWLFSKPGTVFPSDWWLYGAALGAALLAAALAAVPGSIAARRPVADTLSAEGS